MTTKAPKKRPAKRRGPEPDRLKLEGDWKAAVKKTLRKKKPSDGWPKESQ